MRLPSVRYVIRALFVAFIAAPVAPAQTARSGGQQATQGNANADETDLYVLGIDLQNLKHYGDAADAFNRCAQISGGLADRCKQGADDAKKLAQLS